MINLIGWHILRPGVVTRAFFFLLKQIMKEYRLASFAPKPSQMNKLLALVLISLSCSNIFAQESTLNNYTGIWQDDASWSDGSQQPITGIGPGSNINIYGYITKGVTGDLTGLDFAASNETDDFIVSDTLVVHGNVTFANKAMNLVIPVGGVMIIFGDFSATNKIVLSNGGILVITGDANFSPSPQDNYIDGGGEFFVEGTVSGNTDASTADTNSGPLNSSGYTDIINFVNNSGVTPLPIELVNFYGKELDNQIVLEFSTATEENFSYFEIQRAYAGEEFESIGELNGYGNSSTRKDYAFIDEHPEPGLNYYRLKSVDLDGTYEYSRIILVRFTSSIQLEVSPNPTDGSIYLKTSLPTTGGLKYDIVNQYGSVVKEGILSQFNTEVDLASLNKGIYIVRLIEAPNAKSQRVILK